MKQEIIKEVTPVFKKNGELDRCNSISLETWELIPDKRKKPDRKTLEELRYIKKRRLENKKEWYPIGENKEKTIEYSIGELADRKYRRKKREQQIQEIISLLQKIQSDRNILSFSKDFIISIFKEYSKLQERTRRKLIAEILKQAIEKEVIKQEKRLIDICHYEHRLKNEKTTSKNYGINKEWIGRNKIIKTYSFTQKGL